MNLARGAIYLLLLVLGLFACASKPPKSYLMSTEIIANQDINPDSEGKPSPVAFMIYQLKGNEPFEAADFDTLFTTDSTPFSDVVIDKKQYQIQPGKRAMIDLYVSPETNFIGVVAAFREQNISGTDTWSSIVELTQKKPRKAKRYQTNIVFTGQEVKVYLVKKGRLSVF